MNYLEHLANTFTGLTGASGGEVAIFTTGGHMTFIALGDEDALTLETLTMQCSSKVESLYGTSEYCAFYMVGTRDYGTYIIANARCDYLSFTIHNDNASAYLEVSHLFYDEYNYAVESTLNEVWDNLEYFGNYCNLSATENNTQTNYYGNYDKVTRNGEKLIFDFTNLKENIYNDEERQNWPVFLNRGDHNSYYYTPLALNGSNANGTFDISYGSMLYDIYKSGYASGYSNGYTNGLTDYTNSHPNTNVGSQYVTAFDYIGQAFDSVASIMSLEVLPHVTLGLCFSIPLVLVLCMTIFKLVKK